MRPEDDLEVKNLWRRVETRESSYDYQILRPSGSVDDKAGLAARVTEIRAGTRDSSAARVRVPEPLVARGGACGCRWRSGFWVLVAICRGARMSCWFHQAKA